MRLDSRGCALGHGATATAPGNPTPERCKLRTFVGAVDALMQALATLALTLTLPVAVALRSVELNWRQPR